MLVDRPGALEVRRSSAAAVASPAPMHTAAMPPLT